MNDKVKHSLKYVGFSIATMLLIFLIGAFLGKRWIVIIFIPIALILLGVYYIFSYDDELILKARKDARERMAEYKNKNDLTAEFKKNVEEDKGEEL
jgi:cadmium resistance protein CadD (predicted permease)